MQSKSNVILIVSAIFLYILFIPFIAIADVLINEIFYDPAKTGMGCFVELIGTPNLKLDGYRLLGVNGNDGKQYNIIDLSGKKIRPNGFFVIGQNLAVPNLDLMDAKVDYQNGPDNIELWLNEEKVDAVGYGDFTDAIFTGEKKPTLDLSGYSIGRRKDGHDTNDNSVDFVGLAIPSPGETNWQQALVDKIGKKISQWTSIRIGK
jgi:hypothetical protein